MRFYFIPAADYGAYSTTLADAEEQARHLAEQSTHDVTVDLVEVANDKETMLRLLNETGGFMETIREAVYTAKAGMVRGEDGYAIQKEVS